MKQLHKQQLHRQQLVAAVYVAAAAKVFESSLRLRFRMHLSLLDCCFMLSV